MLSHLKIFVSGYLLLRKVKFLIEAREGKETWKNYHWIRLDSEVKHFALKFLFLDHSVPHITSESETALLNNTTFSHFWRIIFFQKSIKV
jgi:hypothetical protein